MRMVAGGETFPDRKLRDAQAIQKSGERDIFAEWNQMELVVDERQRAAGPEQIKTVIGDDAAFLPYHAIGTGDQSLAPGGEEPDLVQRAGRAFDGKAGRSLRPDNVSRMARSKAQLHEPLPVPKQKIRPVFFRLGYVWLHQTQRYLGDVARRCRGKTPGAESPESGEQKQHQGGQAPAASGQFGQ